MAIGFSDEPVPPGTLSGAPTNRKVQRFRLHPVLVLELYEQCCKLDLEGVVAKPKVGPYRELGGKPLWIKVKNANALLEGPPFRVFVRALALLVFGPISSAVAIVVDIVTALGWTQTEL